MWKDLSLPDREAGIFRPPRPIPSGRSHAEGTVARPGVLVARKGRHLGRIARQQRIGGIGAADVVEDLGQDLIHLRPAVLAVEGPPIARNRRGGESPQAAIDILIARNVGVIGRPALGIAAREIIRVSRAAVNQRGGGGDELIGGRDVGTVGVPEQIKIRVDGPDGDARLAEEVHLRRLAGGREEEAKLLQLGIGDELLGPPPRRGPRTGSTCRMPVVVALFWVENIHSSTEL